MNKKIDKIDYKNLIEDEILVRLWSVILVSLISL